MRFLLLLCVAMLAVGAPVKKKKAIANNCVDTPRVVARKKPVLKLDAMKMGLSVDDGLGLHFEMEAPDEKSAEQLEKMVGLLVAAQKLKVSAKNSVEIDLPAATKVLKTGKTVLTTISMSDAQLEKILEARYGKKLVTEARARFIYIYGLREGTRAIAFP